MSVPHRTVASERRRAIALAGVLAIGSMAVVVWRLANMAVLLDLSYVLNTAYRIAAGDVPYRDFPLPYPPLTFVAQSLLIRLFGSHYLVHAAYAVLLDGAATLLSFWIVLRLVRDPRIAAALCSPLVILGVQDIYPHPFYDADAAFLMLAGIAAVLWAYEGESRLRWFAAGAVVPLSVLAKQNLGVAFVAFVFGALALSLLRAGRRRGFAYAAAGALSCAALFAAALQATAGLDAALRWTVGAAAARLGAGPSPLAWLTDAGAIAALALTLASLSAWRRWHGSASAARAAAGALVLPYAVVAGAQLAAPGSAALLSLWPLGIGLGCVAAARAIKFRRWTFATLLPFVCAGVATAAFLSQGVWGSSYALWPLLVIALAVPARALVDAGPAARRLSRAIVPAAAALVLLAAGLYELGESRFQFLRLDGAVSRSTYPSLAGLSLRGGFASDLDAALRYIDARIPPDDAIVMVPGEDPIYFALGRRPRFPVVQFDPTTDPYSPAELRALRDAAAIRWVMVKTDLQSPRLAGLDRGAQALLDGLALVDRVGSYDVYRRP